MPHSLIPPLHARISLVLAGLALLAVACGGSEASDQLSAAEEAATVPQPTAAEPTSEPITEPASAPDPTAAPVPTAVPAPTAEPTPQPVAPPATFSERGPYAVGVTTRSLGDRDVEVWYPVDPELVDGQPTETFDALTAFPETLRVIVPLELSGEYDTLAFRDAAALPEAFPVLIYGHGFGGYRQIATHFTSHLASWGYVVVSADHLERGIAEQTLDLVGSGLFDESNSRPDAAVDDVRNTIDLLGVLSTEGLLAGAMDLDRLAISGHSAGAWAAVQFAATEPDRIDGWISISGGTRDGLALTQPGLIVIGELDAVVPAERSYELFETAGVALSLLNIQGAGHNSFTDPCRGIADLGGLGALTALLGEEQVARAEDGCTSGATEPEVAQAMVNHVTVAWLNTLFDISMAGDPLAVEVVAGLGPLEDYRPN